MNKVSDKASVYQLLTLLQQDSPVSDPGDLLAPIYRELSAALGLDTAIELYLLLRGQQITFPQSFCQASCIRRQVRREYNGENLRELSQKYHRSQKTIRRFLAERDVPSPD